MISTKLTTTMAMAAHQPVFWNKDCGQNVDASLLFIILMGPSEATPRIHFPRLKKRVVNGCQQLSTVVNVASKGALHNVA
jgi:hypothetical protein